MKVENDKIVEITEVELYQLWLDRDYCGIIPFYEYKEAFISTGSKVISADDTKMKLILISGKAQAGKDTTANFLKSMLSESGKKVLIIHYADYLKYICRQFYDWDGVKDEKGRSLLQNFGNNVRQQNPNFWVDTVINFLNIVKDEFDYAIIPDVRYLNEIEDNRLDNDFGRKITVRVERPGFDNGLTQEQKNHVSETCLDDYHFDVDIINSGSLNELEAKVKTFVDILNYGNT